MQEKQYKILNQLIKLVPFDGWSENTLRHATKNSGFEENYASIAFKGGVIDAVTLFINRIDAETYAHIHDDRLAEMKVRERINHILETRFKVMEQYKPTVRKTVQYLSMPQNICAGTKLLWEVADKAWQKAGDSAADFNYYTKRTTLMAVYSSTLLFWLSDESEGHEETLKFLKHRIENVMQFNKLKGKVMGMFAQKATS